MITADRTKANNVALKKGSVKMTLNTFEGKVLILSYKMLLSTFLSTRYIFCTSGNGKGTTAFFALTQQNL